MLRVFNQFVLAINNTNYTNRFNSLERDRKALGGLLDELSNQMKTNTNNHFKIVFKQKWREDIQKKFDGSYFKPEDDDDSLELSFYEIFTNKKNEFYKTAF